MADDEETPDAFKDDGKTPMSGLPQIADAPVKSAVALAAMALNMSIRYHDAGTIKDGNMYREIKMENGNKPIPALSTQHVLETAKLFEKHLMEAESRLAAIVTIDVLDVIGGALVNGLEDDDLSEEDTGHTAPPPAP